MRKSHASLLHLCHIIVFTMRDHYQPYNGLAERRLPARLRLRTTNHDSKRGKKSIDATSFQSSTRGAAVAVDGQHNNSAGNGSARSAYGAWGVLLGTIKTPFIDERKRAMELTQIKSGPITILRLITWTSKRCQLDTAHHRRITSCGCDASPKTTARKWLVRRLPLKTTTKSPVIGAESNQGGSEGTIETVCTLKEKKQRRGQPKLHDSSKAKDYAAKENSTQ
jgi:hypothetical protein